MAEAKEQKNSIMLSDKEWNFLNKMLYMAPSISQKCKKWSEVIDHLEKTNPQLAETGAEFVFEFSLGEKRFSKASVKKQIDELSAKKHIPTDQDNHAFEKAWNTLIELDYWKKVGRIEMQKGGTSKWETSHWQCHAPEDELKRVKELWNKSKYYSPHCGDLFQRSLQNPPICITRR